MNRSVLKNIFVENGYSYANDALQTICSKVCKYDQYQFIKLISQLNGGLSIAVLTYDEEIEYNRLSKSQRLMIDLFNSIVSQGEEFAIQFINANQWAWK